MWKKILNSTLKKFFAVHYNSFNVDVFKNDFIGVARGSWDIPRQSGTGVSNSKNHEVLLANHEPPITIFFAACSGLKKKSK